MALILKKGNFGRHVTSEDKTKRRWHVEGNLL